jgi:putative restriction endonuclease
MPANIPQLAERLSKTDSALRATFHDLVDFAIGFPGVKVSCPPRNDRIVFEGKSIQPRRKNFAEAAAYKSHITLWLNRDADYSKINSALEIDPTIAGASLDKKIALTQNSNPTTFKNLLRMAYSHLSGIDESELGTSFKPDFERYLYETNTDGSGKANSYIIAIELLEQMLHIEPYNFRDCADIWSIQSVVRLQQLRKWVLQEKRKGADSPWVNDSIPASYLSRDYCSSALAKLIDFIPQFSHTQKVLKLMESHDGDADELAQKLNFEPDYPESLVHDPNSKDGKDRIRECKTRVGQGTFREMILNNYSSRCCITGLDIPAVNRASHIIGWADPKGRKIRMDQQNGLCLSATYDAAFDKHLISLDDDYRIILSKEIKEHYTSESVQTHFKNKEGLQITLPSRYQPKLDYLSHHRGKGVF